MIMNAIGIGSMLSNATRSGGHRIIEDKTVVGLYRTTSRFLEMWKSRALSAEMKLMVAQQKSDRQAQEILELRANVARLVKAGRRIN